MKFYRVCHSVILHRACNNVVYAGPYTKSFSKMAELYGDDLVFELDEAMFEHNRDSAHPGMGADLGRTTSECEAYVCGFTTLEMLKEWFFDCFTVLEKAGFVVREFEVHPSYIAEGRYQAGCLAHVLTEDTGTIIPWPEVTAESK